MGVQWYNVNVNGAMTSGSSGTMVTNGWMNTAQGWVQPISNMVGTAAPGAFTVQMSPAPLPATRPEPEPEPEPCDAYKPMSPPNRGRCKVCGFLYVRHPEYIIDLLLEMQRKLEAD